MSTVGKADGAEEGPDDAGISGDSVFHAIGSVDFPWAFPPDAMHLFFENIMKQLLAAWEGEYKKGTAEDRAGDKFVITKEDWQTISKDIIRSNATVPAQIARHINAPLETRSSWTAETYAYFLMFLGPIVMADRLKEPYYKHFLKLSEICREVTKLAISRERVVSLKRDIGEWVVQFESNRQVSQINIVLTTLDVNRRKSFKTWETGITAQEEDDEDGPSATEAKQGIFSDPIDFDLTAGT
ncbi:hypothetical protein QFC20_006523 [Naganishia adeliensis]|uniref:Uncharacterized protein n=1 Tax=Naganishia adeliensis TaxID=92952 RepID=A0ACC2VAB9_9TREE|nr:hypothetical protein QFC20_006523 [Naganishia adeliensis]